MTRSLCFVLALLVHSAASQCGELKGDKGAYAGGAIGGIMMLCQAVGLTFVVLKGGRLRDGGGAAAPASGSASDSRWIALLLVSVSLMGSLCAVGGGMAFLYDGGSDASLASGGFLIVDSSKYGTRGAVASAGLIGGTAFVAMFISCWAFVECLRNYNARLEPSTVPLLVLGWTLWMLAKAIDGFGYVHMYTLDPKPLASCLDDLDASRKARGGIAGFLGLVAWLLTIAAAVIKKVRSSAAAAATDSKMPPLDVLRTVAFCMALGGLWLQLCCSNFESVEPNPSDSAKQGQYAVPGLWFLLTSFLLVFVVFQLRGSMVLGQATGKEHGFHEVVFLLSLAITMFSLACMSFWLANVVKMKNPADILDSGRDLFGFLAFFQAVAWVVATLPVLLRTVTCFQLRNGHTLLPWGAGHNAAVESAYDHPWNLFLAWWSIVMFSTLCFYAYGSASLSASGSPSTNAYGGIDGFAGLVGAVFAGWAACTAAQGKASGHSMASADAQQSASPPAPPARFDPQTGQPIAPDNNMGAPAKRFDPQTGEPIA